MGLLSSSVLVVVARGRHFMPLRNGAATSWSLVVVYMWMGPLNKKHFCVSHLVFYNSNSTFVMPTFCLDTRLTCWYIFLCMHCLGCFTISCCQWWHPIFVDLEGLAVIPHTSRTSTVCFERGNPLWPSLHSTRALYCLLICSLGLRLNAWLAFIFVVDIEVQLDCSECFWLLKLIALWIYSFSNLCRSRRPCRPSTTLTDVCVFSAVWHCWLNVCFLDVARCLSIICSLTEVHTIIDPHNNSSKHFTSFDWCIETSKNESCGSCGIMSQCCQW